MRHKIQRGRPKGVSQTTKSFGVLADLVRNQRVKKGLGLKDVARVINTSVQYVYNVEHGIAPIPFSYIPKVSKVLGLKPEQLVKASLQRMEARIMEKL